MIGCGNLIVDDGEYCDGFPPDQTSCLVNDYDMGQLHCSNSCDAVTKQSCDLFGWERFDVGVDWQFGRVWGTASDNIYAVGAQGVWGLELVANCTLITQSCGRIFRFDGNQWSAHETNTPLLTGVWGSSPENIYAVGFGETILHSSDGHSWTQAYPSDCTGLSCEHFGAIWGSGPDDIFVIGTYYGKILHYDGQGWYEMQTPPIDDKMLVAIWGSGPSDVYVGGTGGVIWHYDGNPMIGWTEMDSGTHLDVNAIWGTSPDNVIASGKDQLILRYDGKSDGCWQVIQEGTEDDNALSAILGISAEEIYIGGNQTPLLHYNSITDAIAIVSENISIMSILGIWGQSGEDFWIAGRDGMIFRRNRRFHWRDAKLPAAGQVRGLWGDPRSGERFAVGDRIWHRREYGEWNVMRSTYAGQLLDIWGIDATDVFAVSREGNILHYDGSVWSKMLIEGRSERLWAVWGSSSKNMFTVGDRGRILHYDGNGDRQWTLMDSTVEVELRSVWGTGTDNVYAVGEDGTILHYNGNKESSWTRMDTATVLPLNAVWLNRAGDRFVVGDRGIILQHSGTQGDAWQLTNSSTVANLLDIWGDEQNSVYAVGLDGIIVHFDGVQWSRIRAGRESQMHTLWGDPSSPTLMVAGEHGVISELTLSSKREPDRGRGIR